MLAPVILCFQKETPSKRRCYVKEAASVGGLLIFSTRPQSRVLRISAAMFKPELQIRSNSSGRPLMKAFAAALIAAAILYVADSEYNDARYTRVVANAVSSVISR